VEASHHIRYLAGDTAQVWRELINLGPSAYVEPVYSDALAVCREIVRRAAANLRTLHARLTTLAYEFAAPYEALASAGSDSDAVIREFETEFGQLPLIARVWYDTFASVNFTQAPAQREYRGREWPTPVVSDVSGLGSHPVLLFQSLAAGRAMWYQLRAQSEEDIEAAKAPAGRGAEAFEVRRFLPLGGWASNCEPIGFPLPSRGVDAVIYNDGGGDIYFVDLLRTAFQWGGFPFWRPSLDRPRYCSPMEYRPNFAAVLPVLSEGLLEL
jgi:hypothetical protein